MNPLYLLDLPLPLPKSDDKKKFIFESMKYCLRNNIISEEMSTDRVWGELDIKVVDYEEKIYFRNSITDYWNFKFKKVILPEGWKMIAHGHDENDGMNPQFLIVDYNIKSPKMKSGILPYFTHMGGVDITGWYDRTIY